MSQKPPDASEGGNLVHVEFGRAREVQPSKKRLDPNQVLARLFQEGLDPSNEVVSLSLAMALSVVQGAKEELEDAPLAEGEFPIYLQDPPPSRSPSSEEALTALLQAHADPAVYAAFQRLYRCLSTEDTILYLGEDPSSFVCAFVRAYTWFTQKKQEGALPNEGLDFVFFFEAFTGPIWLQAMAEERRKEQALQEAQWAERELRLAAFDYGSALKVAAEKEVLEEEEPPVIGRVSLRYRASRDPDTGESRGDSAVAFAPQDSHPLHALEKEGMIFLVLGPRENARECGDITRVGIYVGRGQTREAAAENLRVCLHENGYNCQIRFNA